MIRILIRGGGTRTLNPQRMKLPLCLFELHRVDKPPPQTPAVPDESHVPSRSTRFALLSEDSSFA